MGYRKPNLHHKSCQPWRYCWSAGLTRVFVEPPIQYQQTGSQRSSPAKRCPYLFRVEGRLPYTSNALIFLIHHKIDISKSFGYSNRGTDS